MKGSSLDKYPLCFEKDDLMFREDSKSKDIQTGTFYKNYLYWLSQLRVNNEEQSYLQKKKWIMIDDHC